MSLFGHKQKTVEPDVIPTTVEQAIPIRDVCEDGIFLVGRNLWSKTYRFTDVNYARTFFLLRFLVCSIGAYKYCNPL